MAVPKRERIDQGDFERALLAINNAVAEGAGMGIVGATGPTGPTGPQGTHAGKMPYQADSATGNVEALRNDFNNLLAKLRTAGFMES